MNVLLGRCKICPGLSRYVESYLFMISLLVTILSFDILKCAISYKLKTILTPKILHIVNKVVGVILMAVGLYFIVSEFLPKEIVEMF